jgi:hypothetical protein
MDFSVDFVNNMYINSVCVAANLSNPGHDSALLLDATNFHSYNIGRIFAGCTECDRSSDLSIQQKRNVKEVSKIWRIRYIQRICDIVL